MHFTRKTLTVLALFAVLGLPPFPAPCAAQTCRHWAEVLVSSFFPRQIDEQALGKVAALSPQEYFQLSSQIEQSNLTSLAQTLTLEPRPANYRDQEFRLRSGLARFYDAGFQLFGVRFSGENLTIIPSGEMNAFASGTRIFVNDGLLEYFVEPAGYIAGILEGQAGGYTVEQYNSIRSNFPWRNDWDSIYFILAHEAAHNLMRHLDEDRLESVRGMFQEYQQSVVDYRKDVANGRRGGGVKRYLWKSLQNFAAQSENANKLRARESEADIVGMLLLDRSGLDPAIALSAGERMAQLFSGGQGAGWQAAMTEVLCSDHPGWMERIQQMQVNLNCLRLTGNVCETHAPYPVEQFLPELKKAMTELEDYHQQTLKIAEGTVPQVDSRFPVEVKVEPHDARLSIDGGLSSPGPLMLPVGPHTVAAEKDGFEPSEIKIVVYPDTLPKLKIKLKKQKR